MASTALRTCLKIAALLPAASLLGTNTLGMRTVFLVFSSGIFLYSPSANARRKPSAFTRLFSIYFAHFTHSV